MSYMLRKKKDIQNDIKDVYYCISDILHSINLKCLTQYIKSLILFSTVYRYDIYFAESIVKWLAIIIPSLHYLNHVPSERFSTDLRVLEKKVECWCLCGRVAF